MEIISDYNGKLCAAVDTELQIHLTFASIINSIFEPSWTILGEKSYIPYEAIHLDVCGS